MKDVALGSSIVCSSLASTVLFDFELNAAFAAGIAPIAPSSSTASARQGGALTPQTGAVRVHRWRRRPALLKHGPGHSTAWGGWGFATLVDCP